MITEDFVSFEVAKLLKEKGFNVPTEMVWYEHVPSYNVAHIREAGSKKLDYFYWDENTERNSFYTNDTNENGMPEYIIGKVYSAPTLQMAMKWLREVHQLHISIKPTWALGDMREPCRWEYSIISLSVATDYMYYVGKNTYEEAVEAACLYSLKNLI